MFSKDPTWLAQLSSMTADLTSQQPPVKQAPMLTVAIVLSFRTNLELHVMDKENPPFFRGLAWAVLLMVYCCLRVDDLQGILPSSMSLTSVGFKAVLGRTKTTGTDRRSHEVSVFVERTVSLSGSDWLSEGFKLWKTWETPRDFMIPHPTADWSEPSSWLGSTSLFNARLRLASPSNRTKGFCFVVTSYCADKSSDSCSPNKISHIRESASLLRATFAARFGLQKPLIQEPARVLTADSVTPGNKFLTKTYCIFLIIDGGIPFYHP